MDAIQILELESLAVTEKLNPDDGTSHYQPFIGMLRWMVEFG